MRLLFLTPRLPYPPDRGGEIIVFNFLKHLSARHEIALLSFYDDPGELVHRAVLERYCSRVELVPRPSRLAPRVVTRTLLSSASYSIARHTSAEFRAALGRLRAEWTPDVVQLETFVMGTYLDQIAGVRSVLHMHDVTWIMWERMARVASVHVRPLVAAEARRIRRDELAICRAVDVCIPVSGVDLRHLRSAAGNTVRAEVIVPGVDADALQPLARHPAGPGLVFVGSMHYMPNVDAAEFFVREVLPAIAREVPDVTFTIVGARPPASITRLASDPRVRVTGRVDDVRPYYAAASAAVVPLRAGGGVRMKILEGMALGVPMISTTVGAEGLDLEPGRELIVADTPQQLAAEVVRLLRDPAAADRLARQARETAVRRFGWEAVVARLERVYDTLVPVPTS